MFLLETNLINLPRSFENTNSFENFSITKYCWWKLQIKIINKDLKILTSKQIHEWIGKSINHHQQRIFKDQIVSGS
jgi:hypothetical protein